jgi:hypothetical protein
VCLLSIFPFFNIKVRVRVNVRFRAWVRVMVKLRVRFFIVTVDKNILCLGVLLL